MCVYVHGGCVRIMLELGWCVFLFVCCCGFFCCCCCLFFFGVCVCVCVCVCIADVLELTFRIRLLCVFVCSPQMCRVLGYIVLSCYRFASGLLHFSQTTEMSAAVL